MPRSNAQPNSKFSLLMVEIAYLKSYSDDMLYDFKLIYPEHIKKLSQIMDETDLLKIQNLIFQLNKVKCTPVSKNRVYMISGSNYVTVALRDLDTCVVDNLAYVYGLCNPEDILPDSYAFSNMIYILEGDQLILSRCLSATQAARLMAAFSKENLVNFCGVRYDFYGKPRHRAKKEQE